MTRAEREWKLLVGSSSDVYRDFVESEAAYLAGFKKAEEIHTELAMHGGCKPGETIPVEGDDVSSFLNGLRVASQRIAEAIRDLDKE